MAEAVPVLAVIGRPNVGKSTLVNRIIGRREAVVEDVPGVTRDRVYYDAVWNGRAFTVVDTGGWDPDAKGLAERIAAQAEIAIQVADAVLFVVDATVGITDVDEKVVRLLRAANKPVVLAANKVDDQRTEAESASLWNLGLGEPYPVSALHGRGSGDMLDAILEALPETPPEDFDAPLGPRRVAIVGKPNVGKSSLLNKLVGEERVIVSETPGTTRDTIDTVLRRGDRTFILVDTAGLRRKRKQRQGIEYWSELRAREAAERADVALVLIDAEQGVVEHDLTVADMARKAQCSTLVVLSKWDLSTIDMEETRRELTHRLRQRPPLVAASAKTGRGLGRILDRVEQLFEKHTARVATPELNRFLQELREIRQPPSRNGKRLNLLYGTQTGSRPPRFRFFVNDPGLITRDYGYWVENQLRDRFELSGVPVLIDFVRRS